MFHYRNSIALLGMTAFAAILAAAGRGEDPMMRRPHRRSVLRVAGLLSLAPLLAYGADTPSGLYFSHKDWELACDNTRTCRAAGYQDDNEDRLPVSVLLTREAGPRQPVTGKLMLGDYGNGLVPPGAKVAMSIDKRDLGEVALQKGTLAGDLSPKQVEALLTALSGKSNIEWKVGKNRWRLSDKGAVAVLLKMDEFQRRVGTPGALARRGQRDESAVLPPLPAPIVAAGFVTPPADVPLSTPKSEALLKALRATVTAEADCDLLEEDDPELSVVRLTDTKLLVSAECWRAAYNDGNGYWVANRSPPYHPVLVTDSGSDYSEGTITASQKARGMGDCGSSDAWTWDGERFVHTASGSAGLCKSFAPGGAWSLPTLTTDVRRPPR